jgi:hypothetical protein
VEQGSRNALGGSFLSIDVRPKEISKNLSPSKRFVTMANQHEFVNKKVAGMTSPAVATCSKFYTFVTKQLLFHSMNLDFLGISKINLDLPAGSLI